MDRSMETLRAGLRELGIDRNTLVWFTSDNGGLPKNRTRAPSAGLRGFKGSLYEGGISGCRRSSSGLNASLVLA